MADKRRLVTQLPVFQQTDTLKKFFGATVDELFQPGTAEQLSGYIGEKPAYYNAAKDFYIDEPTATRIKYQLEPAMVSIDSTTDAITSVLFYDDLINQLRFQGGLTDNQQRLFETDYYSWAPAVDIDMLLNFKRYYWLSNGPPALIITVPKTMVQVGIYALPAATSAPDAISVTLNGFAQSFVLYPDSEHVFLSSLANAPSIGDVVVVTRSPGNTVTYAITMERTTFALPADAGGVTQVVAKVDGSLVQIASVTATTVTLVSAPPVGSTVEIWRNSDFSQNIGGANYTLPVDLLTSNTPAITSPIALTSGMVIEIDDDNVTSASSWDTFAWDQFGTWDQASDNNVFVVEGVGTDIILVPEAIANTAEAAQYTVIERGGRDANPWSLANRWFHEDSFAWSGQTFATVAQRPIISFYRNIKLFNYGTTRRPDIQAIFDTAAPNNDFLASYNLQPIGVTLNGRVLQDQDRILTLTADDPLINNRVYRVNSVYDTAAHVYRIHLTLEVDDVAFGGSPQNGDVMRVGLTNTSNGWQVSSGGLFQEIRYGDGTWIPTQYRSADQQPPLFDLYDNKGIYLADPVVYPQSTFAGSQIFGFAIGPVTNTPDPILGIPLRYDQYGQIVMDNYLVTHRYTSSNGDIIGYYYYRFLGDPDTYSNDWHAVSHTSVQTIDADGLYNVPLNLEANPDNEEIDYISQNQYFDHFTGIIASQANFAPPDAAFARNHWRDSKMDLGLGTKILQHRAPLLKLMLLAANGNIDFMLSARYVEREYTRFKRKFVQTMNDFLQQGTLLETDPATQWVSAVLARVKIAKNTQFPFAYSGMAGNQFIPPTPAFLGIMPMWSPSLFVDDTFSPALAVLRGHDGSLIMAFGDFRDNVMLELETQIYNSADAAYRSEARPFFDITAYISGKFRVGDYNRNEQLLILRPMFDRWAVQNQLKAEANTIFVQDEPLTFNYGQMSDYDGEPVPGHWRGMFRWFYDTVRPHSHPWEMLGFTSKPSYWDGRYGPAPYTSGNTLLWTDLANGFIAGGVRQGTDSHYARPGLLSIVPVDQTGTLLAPLDIGLVKQPTIQQARMDWTFGDGGPVEDAWLTSEVYDFDAAQMAYLMKPARFIEECWNPSVDYLAYPTSADQWTDGGLGKRPQPALYSVHGETVNGNIFTGTGIQQWISDYVVSNGQSVTTMFGNPLRGLGVRLAHKMAGFTTTDNMQVRADNIAGPLPLENVNIVTYKSPSTREEIYSGVIVSFTGTGWRVFGYDVLTPAFSVIPGNTTGPKGRLSIAGTNKAPIPNWRPNTYYPTSTLANHAGVVYQAVKSHTSAQIFEPKFWMATTQGVTVAGIDSVVTYLTAVRNEVDTVPYGTEFTSPQEIADFLLGYQRWLVSRGWVFDQIDSTSLRVRDWSAAVQEFLFWISMSWAPGNFIALSPAAAGVKFITAQGAVQDMERLINGVYPLLDQNGRNIDARTTFVSRLDGEMTVVPRQNNIFAARLYIAEIEHILVFSNTTIFNDIIYQPLFNLRQPRLRLIGVRSSDWAGRLDAPGYIITANSIVANFEQSPENIRHMFDIEQSNSYTQYARHDIGYQQRPYLNALMFTDTPQFEFFQGMVQQKGAPGVFQKLLRSDFINPTNDIVFLEEWAVRAGDYGATENNKTIEFQLQQSDVRRNPQLIQFWSDTEASAPASDNPYDDKIELIDKTSPLVPDPRWVVRPDSPLFFDTRDDYAPAEASLPTAGYVRNDELTYHVNTLDGLTALYESLQAGNFAFGIAETIWVYATPLDTFDVLRVCAASVDPSVSTTLLSTEFTSDGTLFTFSAPHGLQVGDLFVLNAPTRSIDDFEGVQTVAALTDDTTQVVIADSNTTTNYDFTSSTDNPDGDIGPQVYALKSVRFATEVTFTPADGWAMGDYVYIDAVAGRWNVLLFDGSQFNVVRAQPHKLDSRKVINGRVYANKTEIANMSLLPQPTQVSRIICFDPVGGLIPGVAEREMTYILSFDPAKYNDGVVTNDPSEAWGETQVGQVWWDLSAVRFLETELDDLDDPLLPSVRYDSDIKYRIMNWGQIAPGTSIDVYEWVRSAVDPTQWTAASKSETDSLNTYSGLVYKADNPSWVTLSEFNQVSGVETTVCFFWVKNRLVFPANMPSRNLSVANVASILTNPTSAIPWLAPVARNSLIISGVIEFLDDDSTVLQINARRNFYEGVAHREWQLLRPKDATSQPDDRLWRKMRDSLVGYDQLLQSVPDPLLFPSQRYGNFIRPRQSWFVDKLIARNVFINAVNLILSRTSLIDDRPNFINDLTATTPTVQALIWVQPPQTDAIERLPDGGSGLDTDEWNIMVADFDARNSLSVAVGTRVLVNRINDDTPQWSVWTYQPTSSQADANGYVLATAWDIEVASLTERDTLMAGMTVGERVLVDAGSVTNNFWTIWRYNGTGFDLVKAQTYDTTTTWMLTDWYATGFSAANPPSISFATVAARNASQTASSVTFVMINNDGTGRWLWTNFANGGWTVVAKQNATVAFTDRFFDQTRVLYGFENYVIGDIPNRDGTMELQIIFDLLRDTGLMMPLELNELFFNMLSYVHSEQDQVDWAFKTSFMVIGNFNSPLDQPAVLPPDENQNLLDFVDEVKPYHVKVRDFRASYAPPIDRANFSVSDFDNPVYLDPATDTYRPLDPNNPKDALIIQTTLPWSLWFSSMQPWTQLSTSDPNNSNMAFPNPVRHSKITLLFDRTSCTPGVVPNAASRISHSYAPQPGMPADNLPDLIGGCQFPGTVVDGSIFGIEGVWDGSEWDNQAWDEITTANLLLDSVVDGGAFSIDPSTLEIIFDGGSFLQPYGPEERVPLRAHDPIVLSVYDNWSAGHPFVSRALYTGDGVTAIYSTVHEPQTNEAVAIFIDGVRVPFGFTTLQPVDRTLTLTASFAPVIGSRIEYVGWGVASLDRIVEQHVLIGDGATAHYATTTLLAGMTVFATVNGQVVATTSGTQAVNFGSMPPNGSLIMITIMLAAPTLVHRQEDTGRLSQTSFAIANPSVDTTGATTPADATIVEVNGLRYAPSQWSLTGTTLSIPGITFADSVSITTFVNNDVMEITTLQYAGNVKGIFEIDHLPHDADYMWLTLKKSGEAGGKRLLFGVDYVVVAPPQISPDLPWLETIPWDQDIGWDDGQVEVEGWDEEGWEGDVPSPYATVNINPSLFSANPTQDIVCWTAMSGNPNHHPIAWRVFVDAHGRTEKIRIADVHKTRTIAAVAMTDQTIDLLVNQDLPASFLPSQILFTPDPAHNQPGVVWIGSERIEYFTLTVVSPTTLRIGQLRRGSRGTPIISYPAGTLVIDGSLDQRFIEDVHAIYGQDWDFDQWEEVAWDTYEYAQDHTDSTAEFLLQRYGTYGK